MGLSWMTSFFGESTFTSSGHFSESTFTFTYVGYRFDGRLNHFSMRPLLRKLVRFVLRLCRRCYPASP